MEPCHDRRQLNVGACGGDSGGPVHEEASHSAVGTHNSSSMSGDNECPESGEYSYFTFLSEAEDWYQIQSGETIRVTVALPPLLRITTSPGVASQVVVANVARDSWGLDWLKFTEGNYNVRFRDVPGFTTPANRTVQLVDGQTTTNVGVFVQRGWLRVITQPALPSTITIDGIARDDWGVWTDVPTGSHQVCYGKVADWIPPPCQTVVVSAGSTTVTTGNFSLSFGAPGHPGSWGLLRVVVSPSIPTQIEVDGILRDTWSLDWVKLAPGSYQVSVTDLEGWTTPLNKTVTVSAGQTTTVTMTPTQRGFLRVLTEGGFPPSGLPGTILVNGIPRNDWGMWTDLPTGGYRVCFGNVPGWTSPQCQNVSLSAGNTSTATGHYQLE